MSTPSFPGFNPGPLTAPERLVRDHALLASIAWLVLIPLGTLTARWLRTFTKHWFLPHAVLNFLVAAPVFWAGWAKGYRFTDAGFTGGHWADTHKKVGLAMLVLYCVQLVLGVFIHAVKLPLPLRLFGRAPGNYVHIALGIALLALGTFQVHYGLYTEWAQSTGNLHPVPDAAKRAWLALIVIFWALYGLGFGLLPRQVKQESAARKMAEKGVVDGGSA
ncbi:hypothetical protein OF83DRAFT_1129912 [Amylostereum chailletii]|nr:hypothetical protein OF83DRAFT_1129912 [Amylostereum chailletii]